MNLINPWSVVLAVLLLFGPDAASTKSEGSCSRSSADEDAGCVTIDESNSLLLHNRLTGQEERLLRPTRVYDDFLSPDLQDRLRTQLLAVTHADIAAAPRDKVNMKVRTSLRQETLTHETLRFQLFQLS